MKVVCCSSSSGFGSSYIFGSYTVAGMIRVELYVVLAVCLRGIAIDDLYDQAEGMIIKHWNIRVEKVCPKTEISSYLSGERPGMTASQERWFSDWLRRTATATVVGLSYRQ